MAKANFQEIINDIKAGKLHPVYFLTGDEPYFIDKIADALDKYVLEPAQRDFNFRLFYGKETSVKTIIDEASRYPMMAERQLIIVKEAQFLKQIEKLTTYVKKPLETTVLVFVYKNKKLDGRKAFAKAIKKAPCLYYESKKLYDNQLPGWIITYVKSMNLKIKQEEAYMLADYLGTDLSKVVNELQKLKLNLDEGATITAEDIERYIGMSKDYNVFELQDALVKGNAEKAFKIIRFFGSNPQEHSMVMIVAVLGSYFSRLYALSGAGVRTPQQAKEVIGNFHPFVMKKYIAESRVFKTAQLMKIVEILHLYDLKSKGVGVRGISEYDLMVKMISDILSARNPRFSVRYESLMNL